MSETEAPSPAAARLARLVPLAMLVLGALVFGLLFSVNKLTREAGVPPIAYAFWQSLGAGVVLLVVAALRGELPRLEAAHLRTYFVSGTLGIGIPISLLAFVAPRLPASVVSLVLTLSPPLTYLFALALRIERVYWMSVLGILFGLGGVLLLIVPEASLPARSMVGWLLLAFLAPACFAMVNVYAGKFRPPAAPSLTLACGLLLGSAIFLVPVMLGSGQTYLMGTDARATLTIVYAILINALFWWLFFEIVRLAGPVFFAQFNYLAVLAGMGWAILLFGERPSAYIWAALVLLFIGLALVHFGTRRSRPAPAPAPGEAGREGPAEGA